MIRPRRRSGVTAFLVGAFAGLGTARLLAPRATISLDNFSQHSGRGTPTQAPSAAALTAGFEPEDAAAVNIFWIMALFAGGTLFAIGLMALTLHVFHRADSAREAGLTALQKTQTLPPEPRLQADPIGDIAGLRRREYTLLHSTTMLNATTARIPIERAMSLVVGQPLDRADTQGNGR